jgi:hypothetical protein
VKTADIWLLAEVKANLGDVLMELPDREVEARAALDEAIDLYRRKGDAVSPARIQSRLESAIRP